MRPTKAKAVAAVRSERGSIQLFILAAIVAFSALTLGGCNTMSGMGEDISAAGGAISQTSERTEKNIDNADSRQQR